MFERFTDRARQVAIDAQVTARRLGHGWVGTEHILLGLLHGDGIAARVLGGLGVTAAAVEREVLAEVGRGPLGTGDAEALGAIGIDLEEVRRRVEASFGPGALRWRPDRRCRRGRSAGWRSTTSAASRRRRISSGAPTNGLQRSLPPS